MRLTPVRIALHFGAWFLCVTVPTYSTAQTTHEFSATTYYNTFSFDHPAGIRPARCEMEISLAAVRGISLY